MGRAWRIEYEGALYHILSRDNEQKDIFYDDQDRLLFLKTIGERSDDHFRQVPRITKADRADRDLLVFSVWKTGVLTDEKIGRLIEMTYSSISHIGRSVRLRMEESRDLKEKFNQIYSLFKI